jgi:hypothetical protein
MWTEITSRWGASNLCLYLTYAAQNVSALKENRPEQTSFSDLRMETVRVSFPEHWPARVSALWYPAPGYSGTQTFDANLQITYNFIVYEYNHAKFHTSRPSSFFTSVMKFANATS